MKGLIKISTIFHTSGSFDNSELQLNLQTNQINAIRKKNESTFNRSVSGEERLPGW